MTEYPPGLHAPGDVTAYCEECRQVDHHPRHIFIGGDGSVRYRHFDCCEARCPAGGICGTILRASHRAHGDALAAWLTARHEAMGPGALDPWLKAGAPIMGGASGMDQNRITDFLNVAVGYSANASSPYTAVLAAPFSASSSQLGHIRLMTVNGSSTSNGTELSGGSYVPGTGITYATGSGGNFGAAAYSAGQGTVQTNTTLSQANMPASTIVGIEIWDSAGTPLRWLWGALQSSVTVTGGSTLSFGSGAVQNIMTA